MKTLLLLRHAKSSWDDPTLADEDRPLAPRGRKAAPRMGRYLEEEGLKPDLILCSPSVRTRDTLALLGPVGEGMPVRFEPTLYPGTPEALLDALHAADDSASRLLLIGHNPGMEILAAQITDTGDPDSREAYRRMSEKFPTAALAVFEAPLSHWADLALGSLRFRTFVRPRDL